MDDFGVVTEPGTLRMDRLLPGPIERVWSYLTDSDKRARWLAAGPMDLQIGGRVDLAFHNSLLSSKVEEPPEHYRNADCSKLQGRVTRCEPPYRLSFTWGTGADASEVSFDLSEQGSDVRLVLTHRRIGERRMLLSVAGGWHTHVGILVDRLNGREPPGFWSTHTALEAEYGRRL
ncbi:ATPase [Solimonas sp. K1W22B-7]|uniref:SRPBCC family protein n=1 Tax=Solimonas sp. K1W22B-7 TaxID=2303331 RepID=UPI000E33211E|nr:SRPBCC family protein [Solimonas sp. K1W22B-7]AXQ31480.1 ATPase [Solimonas sp. K1W22B-7]